MRPCLRWRLRSAVCSAAAALLLRGRCGGGISQWNANVRAAKEQQQQQARAAEGAAKSRTQLQSPPLLAALALSPLRLRRTERRAATAANSHCKAMQAVTNATTIAGAESRQQASASRNMFGQRVARPTTYVHSIILKRLLTSSVFCFIMLLFGVSMLLEAAIIAFMGNN